jgi:ABC-type antimicrobial peptide transport system permease subunit
MSKPSDLIGASGGRVMGMVLCETLLVSGAGTAAGIVTALGLGRFLGSLLFGVTADDTATLTSVRLF